MNHDEVRDEIAEAVLNFFGRDGAPTDTEQALAIGAADRIMPVVQPLIDDASFKAEQWAAATAELEKLRADANRWIAEQRHRAEEAERERDEWKIKATLAEGERRQP